MEQMNLEFHSDRRSDSAWLLEAKENPNTRFVLIHKGLFLAEKNATSGIPETFSFEGSFLREKLGNSISLGSACYLGSCGKVDYFALEIGDVSAGQFQKIEDSKLSFVDLRPSLPVMDAGAANIVALGKFLVFWNRRNQFCGVCGNPTHKLQDGHVLKCTSPDCGEEFYASMDPAVIVLVTSGNKALLGRARNWRSGLYSTLAGFVEPGETLEAAVQREVFEESGIEVCNVCYQASQPWLFPASLMLGFTAKAVHENIQIDPNEMDDVRWFTRDELRASPDSFPSKASIAFRLITSWLDDDE